MSTSLFSEVGEFLDVLSSLESKMSQTKSHFFGKRIFEAFILAPIYLTKESLRVGKLLSVKELLLEKSSCHAKWCDRHRLQLNS